jgi:lipopolysaccharide biosynthesis regulator YciM
MIEVQWSWLIVVPILFGLGWVAARFDLRQGWRESRTLPNSYFRGLNFLLNDQHDRAIDTFIEVVQLDPETIELHFALGGLFRRRGETDRAIRIHQSLLNRADLPEREREHALFELGQDCLKAGMLDRAEEAFLALGSSRFKELALRHRLRLYELVKDWDKAIEAGKALEADGKPVSMSHYYCERAEQALREGDVAGAREQVRTALAEEADAVRAQLMAGRIAFEAGEMDEAIADWQRMADASPEHLGLVASQWVEAHAAQGRLDDGLTSLQRYYEQTRSLDMLDAWFAATRQHKGVDVASGMVRAELTKAPSLMGLDRLLQAQLAHASGEWRSDLELIQSLVHHHTQRLARYRCGQCGFKARQFYWQCPGCNGWGTYPARRMEELVEG